MGKEAGEVSGEAEYALLQVPSLPIKIMGFSHQPCPITHDFFFPYKNQSNAIPEPCKDVLQSSNPAWAAGDEWDIRGEDFPVPIEKIRF